MHLLKDENGNVIPHGDGPAHKHEHDHGCEEHACDGCSGGSDKCKNESVALLNYMEMCIRDRSKYLAEYFRWNSYNCSYQENGES